MDTIPPNNDLVRGKLFGGRYDIRSLVGQGEFAKVYVARDTTNGQDVAVKMLNTDVRENEQKDLFIHDISSAARLNHRNIMPILNFGVENTKPFIVMEYARQGTLRHRHQSKTRVPLQDVVSYTRQVAEALQFAHDREIIHRDVKPENMLITQDGTILLSDFGITSIIEHIISSNVQQRVVPGTPPYMAPEQRKGQSQRASDQYSLGIVVYEWLCGEPPSVNTSGQWSPPSLREKEPSISPAVEQVVLRALEKEPKKRFPTVRDFALALEQAYQKSSPFDPTLIRQRPSSAQLDTDISGRPPSSSLVPPPRRFNFIKIGAVLASLLIILVILYSLLFHLSPFSPSPSISPSTPQPKIARASGTSMFGIDAQNTRYNLRERMLTSTNVSKLDVAWTRTFHSEGSAASSPTVINGTLYIGSEDGKLYTFDANGNPGRVYTTGGPIYSSPAVVDGIIYVGSDDGNLYAFNTATGQQLWKFHTKGGIYSSPTVSHGVVYVGSQDHNLYAINANSGTQIWSFLTKDAILSSPAVSQNIVYVGSLDHNLYAVDIRSGQQIWAFPTGDAIFSSPAVSQQSVVYVGSEDHTLYAINALSGQEEWRHKTDSSIYASPAVTDDTVYLASEDNTICALNTVTGTQLWTYLTGGLIISSPTVANGVVYVGSEDLTIYALDAQKGGKLWSHLLDGGIYSSSTVADGKLYIRSEKGTLYAFHVQNRPT